MKFFGKDISIGKLEIDADSTCADSPAMAKRLDRISTNYEKLDAVLTELETKIAADERLKPKEKKKSKSALLKEMNVKTSLDSAEKSDAPSANPKKPR